MLSLCLSPHAWFAADSPFRRAVAHVVGVRAKFKMIRVDTRRVVAKMQNVHAVRDRAPVDQPGNSVRFDSFPSLDTDLPVAEYMSGSVEGPAFGHGPALNLLKEADVERAFMHALASHRSVLAQNRAKLDRLRNAWTNDESLLTLGARHGDACHARRALTFARAEYGTSGAPLVFPENLVTFRARDGNRECPSHAPIITRKARETFTIETH